MTVAIHMAKRVPVIDWTGVPDSHKGKCSAVCRTLLECEELVRWFGSPDFAPYMPVLVMVPGSDSPTLIPGMGFATAAELQDCAIVAWTKQTEQLVKMGHVVDFDALRERHGLMRREEVDVATRDAMVRRVAHHKANPISDPERQPVYANPTNKTKFVIKEKYHDR